MVLMRPIVSSGISPFAAGTARMAIAALSLNILPLLLTVSSVKQSDYSPPTPYLAFRSMLSGALGMGIGMTLFLTALSHGQIGIVATLAATGPILVLPQLWIITRKAPTTRAWLGGILAVIGSACLVWR